jgi:DNA-binding beta-propeller fold protein YncE
MPAKSFFIPVVALGVLFVGTQRALALPPNGQQQLLVEVSNSILSFDPFTGASYGSFATGVTTPRGMTIGPDGQVYVCSVNGGVVDRFDLHTGTLLGQFAVTRPNDVTFGPDGNLYVLGDISGQVSKFTPNGQPLGVFASGSQISPARTLAFGPDGNLYVGATGLGVIQRFNGTTGSFLGTFASDPQMIFPWSLTFGPDGDLYVLDGVSQSNCVWKFDGQTGSMLGKFTSGGSISSPTDLAFGKDGNLYIANNTPAGVERFSSQSGAYMDMFLTTPSAPFDMVFNPEPSLGLTMGALLLVVRRRRRHPSRAASE